jgi:hypothetical protein
VIAEFGFELAVSFTAREEHPQAHTKSGNPTHCRSFQPLYSSLSYRY